MNLALNTLNLTRFKGIWFVKTTMVNDFAKEHNDFLKKILESCQED